MRSGSSWEWKWLTLAGGRPVTGEWRRGRNHVWVCRYQVRAAGMWPGDQKQEERDRQVCVSGWNEGEETNRDHDGEFEFRYREWTKTTSLWDTCTFSLSLKSPLLPDFDQNSDSSCSLWTCVSHPGSNLLLLLLRISRQCETQSRENYKQFNWFPVIFNHEPLGCFSK